MCAVKSNRLQAAGIYYRNGECRRCRALRHVLWQLVRFEKKGRGSATLQLLDEVVLGSENLDRVVRPMVGEGPRKPAILLPPEHCRRCERQRCYRRCDDVFVDALRRCGSVRMRQFV